MALSLTAADKDTVTWQPIGSRQHPIWWYHHWPPMIYHLTTIPH